MNTRAALEVSPLGMLPTQMNKRRLLGGVSRVLRSFLVPRSSLVPFDSYDSCSFGACKSVSQLAGCTLPCPGDVYRRIGLLFVEMDGVSHKSHFNNLLEKQC